MRPFGHVLLAGLLIGWAGSAVAQQSEESEAENGFFVSPIPKVRVIRPVETDEQATDDNRSETDQQTEASLNPDDAVEGQDSAESDTPNDGSSVRVVFGGSSINQNTRQSQTPTREANPDEDPDADTDEASNEPRWKRERSRRFRRAPERKRFQGVEIAAPIVPIESPDTVLLDGARLRQLDKMTGQTETFDIAVGETRRIARLQVRLDACRAPEDNDTHGTMAFMQIWDTKRPEDPPSFSGWMFAESPALSALDHPRYDLWVINCTTSSGTVSPSSE